MELNKATIETIQTLVGSYEPLKPISKMSKKEKLARRVTDLDLSVRLYGHFKNMGLLTLADVCKLSLRDFYCRRNFGKKSLEELQCLLAEYDLKPKE